MSKKEELIVDDRKLQVSNLDKVLYPKAGFTKAQVIDYYIRIAPVLLPHLKDHPLTMKRYPDGVEGEFFYEKNCPAHRPKWVQTAKVWNANILIVSRRTCPRPCAKEKCSSIGARMTNIKPRSAFIHCARKRRPPFPPPSLGLRSRIV